MPISEKTYRRVALEDPEGKWELYRGQLRSKPAMSIQHNLLGRELWEMLVRQLDKAQYFVSYDSGRARRSASEYFLPDLMVMPAALVRALQRDDPHALEAYADPLPLVVEVWSPSMGSYDARTKLPEYQRRGDAEIWYIHPYDRTLSAWQLQPDGSYRESLHRGGGVSPVALAGVRIDLDALFAV